MDGLGNLPRVIQEAETGPDLAWNGVEFVVLEAVGEWGELINY